MLTTSFISCSAQAADSVEVAKAAPFVEKLVADGYEVLYLTEAIDEAMVTNLAKFNDLELVDVSKEGPQLDAGEDASKKVRFSSGLMHHLSMKTLFLGYICSFACSVAQLVHHVHNLQAKVSSAVLCIWHLWFGSLSCVPRPTWQPHSSACCPHSALQNNHK